MRDDSDIADASQDLVRGFNRPPQLGRPVQFLLARKHVPRPSKTQISEA